MDQLAGSQGCWVGQHWLRAYYFVFQLLRDLSSHPGIAGCGAGMAGLPESGKVWRYAGLFKPSGWGREHGRKR